MKKEKDFYTSPDVDVVELRVEGVICQSGNIAITGFSEDDEPLMNSILFGEGLF